MNKRIEPKRLAKVILTVGFPYAGKSTWARDCKGSPIVSPDEIRLVTHGQRFHRQLEPLVWLIAEAMVKTLAWTGSSIIIVDACHVTEAQRTAWKEKLEGEPVEVMFTQFPATAEQCIERARKAGDEEIVPVIEKMAAQFQPLTESERRQILTEDVWLALAGWQSKEVK